jgi:hypothetical protein
MSSTVQWLVEMSTKFQWRFLFVSLRQACMTAGEATGSVGCLTIHRRRTTDEARIPPPLPRHPE